MNFYLQNWSNRSNEDTIKEYISIMIGGLAGTSTLASATVLALGKMTQVLKAEIPSDVIEMILQNICLLSGLQDREVVGATLDYMKTYLVSYHKDQVLPSVPTLVSSANSCDLCSSVKFMIINCLLSLADERFDFNDRRLQESLQVKDS